MPDFKSKIAKKGALLGLWQTLASSVTAEICAQAGFDWLLFDAEHAPNSITSSLSQLQAVNSYDAEPIARLPSSDAIFVTQYLDIGFNTLLIPMLSTSEQAQELVRASRYPPEGNRGLSIATIRAANFGTRPSYLFEASSRICLIGQIETSEGLSNIDEIAQVDGMNAFFIGPNDLAASMGHLGNPNHKEVQDAIRYVKSRLDAAGKPAGIFALSLEDARIRASEGFRIISVGTDVGLLTTGARHILNEATGT